MIFKAKKNIIIRTEQLQRSSILSVRSLATSPRKKLKISIWFKRLDHYHAVQPYTAV